MKAKKFSEALGNVRCKVKGVLPMSQKRYNTPHRSRVVKTRMTEEEYAEFAERPSAYNMSQAEFKQALATHLLQCCYRQAGASVSNCCTSPDE